MAQLCDHVLRSRDGAVVGLVTGGAGTDEASTPLGGLGPTCGADRRGPSFVDQGRGDAGLFEAVTQGVALVGTGPAARPPVMHAARALFLNTGGVADHN